MRDWEDEIGTDGKRRCDSRKDSRWPPTTLFPQKLNPYQSSLHYLERLLLIQLTLPFQLGSPPFPPPSPLACRGLPDLGLKRVGLGSLGGGRLEQRVVCLSERLES